MFRSPKIFSRRVRGHTDMGMIRIPALPQFIVMTDRADGKLWVLTHGSDGEHIAINDDLTVLDLGQRTWTSTTYGPNDGPYLPTNPGVRLIVRAGRLGYEFITQDQGVSDQDQARLLTRRRVQRT